MSSNDNHQQCLLANLSAAIRNKWTDPEYRAKVTRGIKERWKDPEYRKRVLLGRANSEKRERAPSPTPAINMSEEDLAAMRKRLAADAKRRKAWKFMTDEQRELYRLYKKKKFSVDEALSAIGPIKYFQDVEGLE